MLDVPSKKPFFRLYLKLLLESGAVFTLKTESAMYTSLFAKLAVYVENPLKEPWINKAYVIMAGKLSPQSRRTLSVVLGVLEGSDFTPSVKGRFLYF